MSMGMVAAMVFVLLLTIVVPLGVMRFLRQRGGTWKAFLIGAGTFTVFAMVLEQILHFLVLRSGVMAVLQGNIWLYGLYGGLAAGVFEETGRLLAFRFLLKNRQDRITALSYGIGHGGFEAFLVVGMRMAANLALGLIYARGGTVPSEMIPAVESLLATPAAMFLWSGFERMYAMLVHMALSVLVFAAVRTGKRRLFFAAILLHTAVNCAAVVLNTVLPLAATEILLLLAALVIAGLALAVYKKLPEFAQTP